MYIFFSIPLGCVHYDQSWNTTIYGCNRNSQECKGSLSSLTEALHSWVGLLFSDRSSLSDYVKTAGLFNLFRKIWPRFS